MPIIVQGGDSQTASQRDLTIFALCSLIDKRDASKGQLNIIAFSVFCSLMATWGLKVSLAATCILLCISIGFALYALYAESRTLRQIQRELLSILRDTPRSDIEEFFNDAVHDLHQD
jgi:ABC-type proline/glycine betaine transport system permease subunit